MSQTPTSTSGPPVYLWTTPEESPENDYYILRLMTPLLRDHTPVPSPELLRGLPTHSKNGEDSTQLQGRQDPT